MYDVSATLEYFNKRTLSTVLMLASPAGVFRGDRISSLVGRKEIRSPLKTPAGVAMLMQDNYTYFCRSLAKSELVSKY